MLRLLPVARLTTAGCRVLRGAAILAGVYLAVVLIGGLIRISLLAQPLRLAF